MTDTKTTSRILTNNFAVQAAEAEHTMFTMKAMIEDLARECGGNVGNNVVDCCDVMFPTKESYENFKKMLVKKGVIDE